MTQFRVRHGSRSLCMTVLLLGVLATGCNFPQPALTPLAATPAGTSAAVATLTPLTTVQIVTQMVTQVVTVQATSAVPTAISGITQPSPTDSEQAAFAADSVIGNGTTPTPGTRRVKLFLVALEDNGRTGMKIGCNDSLVGVDRDIPRTASPLTDTLNLLFSLTTQNYGQSGLYNALYQSNLRVEGISAHNGVFRVNLVGQVALGGVCDNPRFVGQITQTITQFATVKQVSVFINGKPLESYLSESGN